MSQISAPVNWCIIIVLGLKIIQRKESSQGHRRSWKSSGIFTIKMASIKLAICTLYRRHCVAFISCTSCIVILHYTVIPSDDLSDSAVMPFPFSPLWSRHVVPQDNVPHSPSAIYWVMWALYGLQWHASSAPLQEPRASSSSPSSPSRFGRSHHISPSRICGC